MLNKNCKKHWLRKDCYGDEMLVICSHQFGDEHSKELDEYTLRMQKKYGKTGSSHVSCDSCDLYFNIK